MNDLSRLSQPDLLARLEAFSRTEYADLVLEYLRRQIDSFHHDNEALLGLDITNFNRGRIAQLQALTKLFSPSPVPPRKGA